MALNAELRTKILNYVRHADREIEPVFVGREDLFAVAADAAGSCADGHPRGQTVCLAGPPGIGKSAFLDALQARSQDNDWGGPPTLTVPVAPDDLWHPHRVLWEIGQALPDDWRKGAVQDVSTFLRSLFRRGFSLGAFGLGASVNAAEDEGGDVLAEGLFGLLRDAPKGAAVCLAVDEAHGLEPTPGKPVNLLLRRLHMGKYKDFPVFALLAGHSQTLNVIRASVSRRLAGGHLKHMQPLSRSESKEYVSGILDYCGIQGPTHRKRKFAGWTADLCKGFPHHLRSAMTALGREALRIDSVRLRDLDASRMAKEVGRLRKEYYQHRMAGLGPATPVVRAVLAKWGPDGAPSLESAADDLADAIADVDARRLARMRKAGIEFAEDVASRMISSGLLSADAQGERWRCVIPSLRQYVLSDQFETPPPPDLAGTLRIDRLQRQK